MKDKILQAVTRTYLNSHDFNGTSAAELERAIGVSWPQMRDTLHDLIENELVGLLPGGFDCNTHILRVGFPQKEIQFSALDSVDLFHTCAYPRTAHLMEVVNKSRYDGQPYNLCLALGEPQPGISLF